MTANVTAPSDLDLWAADTPRPKRRVWRKVARVGIRLWTASLIAVWGTVAFMAVPPAGPISSFVAAALFVAAWHATRRARARPLVVFWLVAWGTALVCGAVVKALLQLPEVSI